MSKEFCKRHSVDHYGTWCGFCVEIWKKKAAKYDRLRKIPAVKKLMKKKELK